MIHHLPLPPEEEEIGKALVDAACQVHKELGPGLLEKVYEACLTHALTNAGFVVRRQVDVPLIFKGLVLDEGLRLDLLINDRVICELKAVDTVKPCLDSTNY